MRKAKSLRYHGYLLHVNPDGTFEADLVPVKAEVHTTRPLPGQKKVERKIMLVSRSIADKYGYRIEAGKRRKGGMV